FRRAHANRSGEEGASAQPTPFTRRSGFGTDSVHGHLGPGHRRLRPAAATTSRRSFRETGAGVGSTGLAAAFGWRRETETCWDARGFEVTLGSTGAAARPPGRPRLRTAVGNGAVVRSRRN